MLPSHCSTAGFKQACNGSQGGVMKLGGGGGGGGGGEYEAEWWGT